MRLDLQQTIKLRAPIQSNFLVNFPVGFVVTNVTLLAKYVLA